MTLRLVFRPIALVEFNEATLWYEEQRAGLGEDFIGEVQNILDSIINHPERYPIVEESVREAPVARFPYCIYFRLTADRIEVIAVFHSSRDPSIWQGRISPD